MWAGDRVGIHLVSVYDDPATTLYAKACVTYIRVTLLVPNVITTDVFGTGIFH